MHSVEDMLVEKNYSKCPLKKRPVNYQFEDPEPQDLCVKKQEITEEEEEHASEELINVSDCCEDEGVDVDHTDEEEMELEEDEEDEDVDVDVDSDANQTQAAALAAAAAVAAVASAASVSASVPGSVIMPTPTYPKYPWNFHMSPYTAEFYRTINHQGHQISPLRGDLMAPSSPSDSLGSLSPPPHHYLHGRASSVSPPMRSEIIHRPIGVRQHHHQHQQHRFLPYPPMPSYPALGGYHHHAPISPAYSENSYYSMRSMTPESSCSSSLPEDLSLKHLKKTLKSNVQQNELTPTKTGDASTSPSSPAGAVASGSSGSSKNKDKSQPPRYQCPDCQKSYSTFSGLTKHQQFHCPAAEGNQVKKSFSCKDCDKTYVSLGALKMHIRTHTLPCKCNLCGKAFSRPWLLQGHIRTHTGEKPFSCQHCHRAFADRSNLRAHLQTHSDIKKYSCTSCSKTFSRMSLLTKHSEGGCPGGNASGGGGGSSSELSYAGYAEP